MKRSLTLLPLFLLLFAVSCTKTENQSGSLPRSTPLAEGVAPENILDFLDAMSQTQSELHSLMILRHGKVVAEGWWNPYQPELKHTLYSTSKSFTSTAIGFAVSEKRLTLNDKVISFFPKDVPAVISPNLAALSVKDLITMSAGQEPDPTFEVVTRDSNWVKSFLSIPILHKPGSQFLYNTLATYMLSAIVQKVTGEKVLDYLKPRLFEPLKISGMDWETDPAGRNTGGWGLRLKTEDMAKFGQLLLQKGKWNDMQILPVEWVDEATSFKIDQDPAASQAVKDSSDWKQGYCYQFWRCRHNAFRADGAYGQYIIVFPELDAVIAITGESPNMQDELNLVWKFLLPAFKKEALPENKVLESKLADKLASLALPLFPKSAFKNKEAFIDNQTFRLDKTDSPALDSFKLNFKGTGCEATLFRKGKGAIYKFNANNWAKGETALPGPSLLIHAIGAGVGHLPYKVAGNYYWKDSVTLDLKLRYIESPHAENMQFRFSKDSVYLNINHSQDFGKSPIQLKGKRRR